MDNDDFEYLFGALLIIAILAVFFDVHIWRP
jgi:hypothetical protein